MDIKERIDALSEAEAKDALAELISLVGTTARCRTCIFARECYLLEEVDCKKKFLDWILGQEGEG